MCLWTCSGQISSAFATITADADGILPQAIRSAELRVRLPRHHIDMLEYRADQQETTISGVLARELDGIASAHLEELSGRVAGVRRGDGVAGELLTNQ